MKRWSLPSSFFALALATATSACAVEAAPGSTATATSDGAAKAGAHKPKDPPARASGAAPDAGSRNAPVAAADGDSDPVDPSDSPIGLTRAKLRARRGPPTEIHGNDWIYTPDQAGCRDVIISEVMTFKNGVVSGFRLQRRQTGKACRGR